MPLFSDPYLYPGTQILINNFNIKDAKKLAQVERAVSWEGRQSLEIDPINLPFTLEYLQAIHQRLFGKLYPWAGKLRTVNISKGGNSFLPADRFDTAGQALKETISQSGLLDKDLPEPDFIHHISDLLADLNYIHPFREGNGRSQRAFIDMVAKVSGRKITWRNISTHDYMLASIETFHSGNGKAFIPLFPKMLLPPVEGLSILDSSFYAVTPLELNNGL